MLTTVHGRQVKLDFELIYIITEPDPDLKATINLYGKENLSLLHIMIQSPYITKIRNDLAMTFTNYVANTGGILGLCLGFSFISCVEILYWCCCCCCCRQMKKNTVECTSWWVAWGTELFILLIILQLCAKLSLLYILYLIEI